MGYFLLNAEWLWEGAPSGIDDSIAELGGIFPIIEDEDTTEPDALWTDHDSFSNHATVEDDDAVEKELETIATNLGFLNVCILSYRRIVAGEYNQKK